MALGSSMRPKRVGDRPPLRHRRPRAVEHRGGQLVERLEARQRVEPEPRGLDLGRQRVAALIGRDVRERAGLTVRRAPSPPMAVGAAGVADEAERFGRAAAHERRGVSQRGPQRRRVASRRPMRPSANAAICRTSGSVSDASRAASGIDAGGRCTRPMASAARRRIAPFGPRAGRGRSRICGAAGGGAAFCRPDPAQAPARSLERAGSADPRAADPRASARCDSGAASAGGGGALRRTRRRRRRRSEAAQSRARSSRVSTWSRWSNLQVAAASRASTRSATMCTPMPGPRRHEHGAIGLDVDRRVDQILRVVAAARRDVAGQREVRRAWTGEGCGRGRCPTSSMPPCQTGTPRAGADVVHADRLRDARRRGPA